MVKAVSIGVGGVTLAGQRTFHLDILKDNGLRTSGLIFLAVLVSVILASTRLYENEDAEYKWAAIATWANGEFPDFAFNHHNLRWAMNAIGLVWVYLFGDSPLSYLTLNYIAFSLSTAGLYWLARDMMPKTEALIVLAIWLLNPIIYLLPSNFMPELYGQLYLIIALILLRIAYVRNSRVIYAASIFAFFCMYGAKETNAFIMPGLGLWELARRRFDNVAIMIAVFGGGLLIETGIVNWIGRDQGLSLGRLELIAHGKHVKEMNTIFADVSPSDILRRWAPRAVYPAERNEIWDMQLLSKLLYLAFFAVAPGLCVLAWLQRPNDKTQPAAAPVSGKVAAPLDSFAVATIAMGLSFAVCTTFFIISLDPFLFGQPLVDRYLWILLTPAILTFGVGLAIFRGPGGSQAGANQWATKVLAGLRQLFAWTDRHSLLIIAAILLASTGLRFAIDSTLERGNRRGAPIPYAYLDASVYYSSSVREPLERGCTLVFASPKAAWSALIFGFPHGAFPDSGQLYAEQLDGLKTRDGATVRAQRIKIDDKPGLAGKLYAEDPYSKLTALKIENGQTCSDTYYLGHLDIPKDQQLLK